jgi:hypothetical protein
MRREGYRLADRGRAVMSSDMKELPAARRMRRQREAEKENVEQKAIHAFDGTTAGRLLSSLYANQKPKINYPKLRTKTSNTEEKPKFIPGGAKPGHHDCRIANKKSTFEARAKKKAPTVGMGKRPDWAPIDFVQHRKREGAIVADAKEAARRDYWGAGHGKKSVSTVEEKDRLQRINTYGGGKALPDEMMLGQMDMPKRASELRLRNGKMDTAKPVVLKKKEKGPAELFDQIVLEVQERKDFLDQMTALGKEAEWKSSVEAEIRERVADMERLNKMMAN